MSNSPTPERRADPAAVPATEQPAASPQTILIVEGRRDSLRAMCMALAGENYGVETAGTATPVAQKVAACRPDLILLDSQLLDANGTRLARHLLADEDLASVPIVALTEIATGTHGVGGPVGAYDGEIQIPIDAGTLAAQVRGLLQSSALETAGPPVDLIVPFGAEVNRMEAAQLLDSIENGLPDSQFAPGVGPALQRLAEVEGTRHLVLAGYLKRAERLSHARTVRARRRFRLIVGLCREQTERDADAAPEMAELRIGYLARRQAELRDLEQALQQGDLAAIRKAGHNLKGTGAAYGFAEITHIGRSLEAAAKGGDAGAIEILLDEIDSYLAIVRPSLTARELDAAAI